MSQFKIQTYTGKLVDYLEPTLDSICIEDIAKALSQECRFASQSKRFYSVAQHSILVCGFALFELKLEALLHDAEEAYIKDLPSPLTAAINRGMVRQYLFIKQKIRKVIADKFQLDYTNRSYGFAGESTGWQIIKEIDLRMVVTERNQLFKNPLPLFEGENIEPYNFTILPESMIDTEKKFLEMFDLYRRDK